MATLGAISRNITTRNALGGLPLWEDGVRGGDNPCQGRHGGAPTRAIERKRAIGGGSHHVVGGGSRRISWRWFALVVIRERWTECE